MNVLKNKSFFVMLLILLPFFLFPVPSFACSCGSDLSPTEALNKSTAVFIGTVNKIEKADSGYEVTFQINKNFKEATGTEITVFTGFSSCMYNFKEMTPYLVYATTDTFTGVLSVNFCSRTVPLIEAKADLIEIDRDSTKANTDVNVTTITHYFGELLLHLLRYGMNLMIK
ncbi:hypothetical protein [Brevibacillus sp. SIMBA_040]|uniref:hypothetical protein n=1 Tax=unclassified Brevibacillus TaxID=2684853 RepID=UPI003978E936